VEQVGLGVHLVQVARLDLLHAVRLLVDQLALVDEVSQEAVGLVAVGPEVETEKNALAHHEHVVVQGLLGDAHDEGGLDARLVLHHFLLACLLVDHLALPNEHVEAVDDADDVLHRLLPLGLRDELAGVAEPLQIDLVLRISDLALNPEAHPEAVPLILHLRPLALLARVKRGLLGGLFLDVLNLVEWIFELIYRVFGDLGPVRC